MVTSSASFKFARPSRLHLGAIVFLWGTFAFFTVCQLLRQDAPEVDAAKIKELENVSLPAAVSSAHDWPQWRGPNRDGVSTETGLLTTWPPAGPAKLWEQSAGEGFSSLAVAEGRVFTMVQHGGDEAIVAWDADTGRELWRHRYPARFRQQYGNGPRSTPTVDGDLLFAVGATGIMTCLKIRDAGPEVVWSKRLLEEFGAGNLQWGISASPLVAGNLVYVNPGGPGNRSLVALDKFTGAVRWQALDDAAANSSPVIADIAGQRQVVFFTEQGLAAVTPDQGKLLWRFPWQTPYGANVATPIVAGDFVFISSGYGKGCALLKIEKTEQGLTANRVYKNLRMKAQFSSCVLYKDHLYGFDDTILTCMEFRSGKVAWTERGLDKGSLLIADGHLFILGEFGTLAVAEAAPDAYREKGRFSFSSKRCWTVPVIANGRLYVRNEEKAACYELRK